MLHVLYRPPPRSVLFLLSVVASLVAPTSWAQTSRSWRITPVECQSTSGLCGCDKARVDSLKALLACASPHQLKSRDRIVYECSDLANGCEEQGPIFVGGGTTAIEDVEVVAKPTRRVTIQGVDDKGALVVEANARGWSFEGFVFDGQHVGTDGSSVVRIKGDRSTIRRSKITGGVKGSCLQVVGNRNAGNTAFLPVQHFTLESSEVTGCYDSSNRNKDVHCIQSYSGQHMVIRDNFIHQCQGDGIQLEHDYIDQTCYPDPETGRPADMSKCIPGAWQDVTISGNVFESRPDDVLASQWEQSPVPGVRPGENAVDLKSGGGNVLIQGNVMRGYRGYDGAGGGYGSGTDGQGSAITFSGPFVACSSNCVSIIGNDIMDSNIAIAASHNSAWDDKGSGLTEHVLITRNVIHHLTADGARDSDLSAKGSGVRLARRLADVHVSHNTFASTPGNAFYVPPDGSCSNCSLTDNLLSYAGAFDSTNSCNSGSGDIPVARNLCAPENDTRRECDVGEGNLGSVKDVQFFDDSSSDRPSSCGLDVDPSQPGVKPATWDYSPALSSAAIDAAAHANNIPGARCDSAGAFDGAANRDTGAIEYCSHRGVELFPNVNAELTVKAGGPYRLAAEFVYAKGAYADALQLQDLPGFCPGKNSTSGEGEPLQACLFSTHQCLNLCGRARNGEIDCSCLDNVERQLPMGLATEGSAIAATLQVDWQADLDYDERRWGLTPGGPSGNYQAVGFTKVSNQQYLLEWEDLETDIQVGDRNDFIASVRGQECTTQGLQDAEVLRTSIESSCIAQPGSCQACGGPELQAAKVGVSAVVTADPHENEDMPEFRQLFVTVSVWRGADHHDGDTRVAVCPVLYLKDPAVSTPVLRSPVRYQGSGGGTCDSSPDAIPDCDAETSGAPTIAFSRAQRTELAGNACAEYPPELNDETADDSFVLEPAKRCGNVVIPTAKTVTFPISFFDLIAAMPPGTSLGHGTSIESADVNSLEEYIDRLAVYVFSDIQKARFMCPSGLNVVPVEGSFASSSLAHLTLFNASINEVGPRQ